LGCICYKLGLGDVASDDATKGSDISDQSTIVPVENYSVDATNGYVADSWRFRYDGVARANAVLQETWQK